jgi:hypothetical protein
MRIRTICPLRLADRGRVRGSPRAGGAVAGSAARARRGGVAEPAHFRAHLCAWGSRAWWNVLPSNSGPTCGSRGTGWDREAAPAPLSRVRCGNTVPAACLERERWGPRRRLLVSAGSVAATTALCVRRRSSRVCSRTPAHRERRVQYRVPSSPRQPSKVN